MRRFVYRVCDAACGVLVVVLCAVSEVFSFCLLTNIVRCVVSCVLWPSKLRPYRRLRCWSSIKRFDFGSARGAFELS